MAGCAAAMAANGLLPDVLASSWGRWLLIGLALLAIAVSMAAGCYLAVRTASCERLARRADRNGRALLELADEIEHYLLMQRMSGASTQLQGHWPWLCRRLAMEHLECINRLMLESMLRR